MRPSCQNHRAGQAPLPTAMEIVSELLQKTDYTRRMKTTSFIEPLESRIAPAALVTITDLDGDTVAVKTSKGTVAQLTAALKLSGAGLTGQIREIDFSTVPLMGGVNPFAGTDLTVSVVKRGANGDGRVNVGYIDAAATNGGGMDGAAIGLGSVKIGGDLGQIDAGMGGTNVAIKSLTMRTLGAWGTGTQGANGSTTSSLAGKVGTIKVTTMTGVSLDLSGAVASLNIAGSILDSAITGTADLAKVRVGAGAINSSFAAKSIVKMDVVGTLYSSVGATGTLGSLTVKGDFVYRKISAAEILNIAITGSVYGLEGIAQTGLITASGKIGKVKIGGDLRGASADQTGRIAAGGNIGSVTIKGSLVGPIVARDNTTNSYIASNSSSIVAGGNLTSVRIGGNIIGPVIQVIPNTGPWFASYCCTISAVEDIGTVSIGGSVVGIAGDELGTRNNVEITARHIGSVSVGGDFTGTGAASPGIYAEGSAGRLAIGKIVVKGSFRLAAILAGTSAPNVLGAAKNADGQIGSVFIGGNLASATVATYDVGAGITDNGSIISKISSITVGGQIIGNSVVRAEHIVSAKLGGLPIALQPGERNDTMAIFFPPGSGSIAEYT